MGLTCTLVNGLVQITSYTAFWADMVVDTFMIRLLELDDEGGFFSLFLRLSLTNIACYVDVEFM